MTNDEILELRDRAAFNAGIDAGAALLIPKMTTAALLVVKSMIESELTRRARAIVDAPLEARRAAKGGGK